MINQDGKVVKTRGLTDPTRIIILVAFYFIGGYFGNLISFMGGKVALIWPPSGIALAAILLLGYHFWPGVALGAVLFSLIKGEPPVFFTMGSAIGNTIGAVVCTYLLERSIHFSKSFRQIKDAIGFIIFACLIGTTVNAFFNVVGAIYDDKKWDLIIGFDPELLKMVLLWWVPNAMGALVITPLILAWTYHEELFQQRKRQVFEGLVCCILLILSCYIAFSSAFDSTNYPFAYLPYPFLIWATVRFGLQGATTGTFIVSISGIYALRSGIGPFNFTGNDDISLMVIGSYIGVMAVSNLILAAATKEREVAQQEVLKNQRLYRAVVEDQTDLISRFKSDGTITFANEAFCRFHGMPSEKLIGSKTPMLTGSSSKEHLDRISNLTTEKPDITYDYFLTMSDGAVLWHQCTLRKLMDDTGYSVEYQAVEQDITQRKRAEEALRKSEEMFNLISQNVDDLIAVTDAEGRRVFNNPSYSKIFGRHENLKGTDSFEQIHPDDKEMVKAIFRETIETGIGKRLEYRFLLPDGSIHYVDSVGNFVPGDPGKLGYLVTIGRDITERKRIEKDLARARDAALIAAKQKAEFLANMSHEIRTPLNGVIGLTNLLMRSPLAKQQKEYVEKIRSCSDALMSIINDVLDFSKIEAGKLQSEVIDFSLLHAVETSVELFTQRAQDKGIVLASYVEDNVPIRLRGDLGHIRQVIVNLVGNAVKFTHQGEVILQVRKVSETEKDVTVRFEVKDTGIGIPTEAQPNLFISFSQADGSTTRKYGGTGLGLAICKQLVSIMGGQIGLESTPGVGSLFWFVLTLQKQDLVVEKVRQFKDIRVLLVDCNRTMRDILLKQCQAWKMAVEALDSGPQLLEKMCQESVHGCPFHLVIFDTENNKEASFESARILKSDPILKNIKIILLYSFGTDFDTQTLRACGIDKILEKPIKQSALFDCIGELLGYREPEQNNKETKKIPIHRKSGSSELKILLAEDNSINQLVALGELKELGYTADAVADGLEVLEALERVPYELILMDCQMPNMDGYEATRKIREKEKNGVASWPVPITIIAMTAHALEGDREKCIDAGMDDYLTKPVEQNTLLSTMERWSFTPRATGASPKKEPLPPANDNISSVPASSPKADNIAAEGSQPAPVDFKRLERITHGNADRLKELINLYLKQTTGLCQQIEEAVQKGAIKEIEQYSHKICGSSANCGVLDMVQFFRNVEHLARAGKFEELKSPWQIASNEFLRVKQCMEDYVAKL